LHPQYVQCEGQRFGIAECRVREITLVLYGKHCHVANRLVRASMTAEITAKSCSFWPDSFIAFERPEPAVRRIAMATCGLIGH
jgi:hypothetical protein